MNCYYSNLIEGHDTHPVDIERALKNDYSDNPDSAICNLKRRRILLSSNGLMKADCLAKQLPAKSFVRFTGALPSYCRMKCCG